MIENAIFLLVGIFVGVAGVASWVFKELFGKGGPKSGFWRDR